MFKKLFSSSKSKKQKAQTVETIDLLKEIKELIPDNHDLTPKKQKQINKTLNSFLLEDIKYVFVQAARDCEEKVIKVLINYFDTEAKNNSYKNLNDYDDILTKALVIAAQNGHKEIVRTLINIPETSIDAKDKALVEVMLCLPDNCEEIVKILIGANANIYIEHKDDLTIALHMAENSHHEKIVALLSEFFENGTFNKDVI